MADGQPLPIDDVVLDPRILEEHVKKSLTPEDRAKIEEAVEEDRRQKQIDPKLLNIHLI